MRKPSYARVGACDRGGNRLLDFVGQSGGQFPEHVHAIDMRKISLELPQPFALLLGMFSLCYIHRDTDILTEVSGGIVVSHGTQKSDSAVRSKNPMVIRFALNGSRRTSKMAWHFHR